MTSGVVLFDHNDNGSQETGDLGLASWTVFLDQNKNGRLDPGERFTTTSATGSYTFTGLDPGPFVVQEVTPVGWIDVRPGSVGYTVSLASGQTITEKNFSNL